MAAAVMDQAVLLNERLTVLDERIGGYGREIEAQARLSEPAQRLMKIRGRTRTACRAGSRSCSRGAASTERS